MASFYDYVPFLKQVEGGYQNHPDDDGNYNSLGQLVGTNHGISAPIYEKWIKRVPTVSDMKNMLKGTALEIFLKWFWQPLKCDYFINQSVANIFFDHAINAGNTRAITLLQKVLVDKFNRPMPIDGIIGTLTIGNANSVNQEQLHQKIKEYRKAYYEELGGEFEEGWLNRLRFFFIKKKPAQK